MNNAGLINVMIGLVVLLVSLPLVYNKIKMNRWYGIRMPKSYKSDENWYKINAYGGKLFVRWSIIIIMSGLMYFLLPLNEISRMIFSFVPVLLLIPTIQILIYSNKV